VEGPRLGDRASGPEALHWGEEVRFFFAGRFGEAPGLERQGLTQRRDGREGLKAGCLALGAWRVSVP
jgi:hypothetical protein